MHVNSTGPLSGLKPIAATCLFSLFLAGCGGGGGGGNGSTGITSEQQTALAAKTAAGTAQFAQSFARSQTEDSDSGAGTSAQTSGQVVTRSENTTDCTNGQLVAYDNETTVDTALDIGGETFPALFSGTVSEADGNQDYYQVRSDCVESNFEIVGSADVALLEVGGDPDRTALAYRAGGFPGDYDASTPVDTDASLDIYSESSAFFIDMSITGVMHACNGCWAGDLDNFGVTPDLNVAAAAWLDMSMDFGDGTTRFVLGESASDRFTLVSREDGGDLAAVDINGRLAVDNPGNDCDFDVTYDTVDDILITDFDTGATGTVGGTVDVTNNDAGDTVRVTFDSSGNVYVDGDPVDIEDEEQACTLSS